MGDQRLYFRVHQLDLGLAFKLRVGMLDADDGCHAFSSIIAGEVGITILDQAVLAGVVIQHTRGRGPESGQMCTAIDSINGVGKTVNRFII